MSTPFSRRLAFSLALLTPLAFVACSGKSDAANVPMGPAPYFGATLPGETPVVFESATLKQLAPKLDPSRFVRTHRSWIVNLDHVREAQPWTKGSWILLTRGGLKVPVGQQYRDVLTRLLA